MRKKPGKSGMISEERRLKILEVLDEKRTVTVKELSGIFGVSEDTIRQDLKTLEEQRLLRRIYGGATRIKRGVVELPFTLREITNRETKELIGKKAAKLIEDGDSVVFDASTTALQVARNISPGLQITILTSSLDICINLAQNRNFNIISTGGTLHPPSFSFVGPQAENAVRNYHADKVFIGTKAISVDKGYIADAFELEAHLKKVMIESAQEVILVAESRKFEEVAFFRVCKLDCISKIVTDGNINEETLMALRDLGVEVLIGNG